ncbi:hypothetical protein ACGFSI_41450 [Streptomyces virginiae]|uniref:hypothetical protein n=1 Tax=Streptomyces virginiae TaxID=1961 RepID=UPI00371C1D55
MTERARPTFEGEAVAKALGTTAQDVTDPAYGEGRHFQVASDSTFLSLDTFPESGVSRITTKGARIELFDGMLPRVEDEGIVFLQKDSDHEHSTVSLSPDGGMTMGYQVDTGPAPIDGLPQDIEDTERIITSREAVNTPAAEPEPATPAKAAKPLEKPTRTSGAFPDVRPMTQVAVATPEPSGNGHVTATAPPQESPHPADDPLKRAVQIRDADQAARPPSRRPRRPAPSGSSSSVG